jgi:uncharacterized protein (DUF1015 family)
MAIIKPFKGIRPPKELVEQVASRPYDVLNSEEAREEAKGNEKSLYHIIKPEIDFPAGTDEHDPKVYEKAAENFQMFQDKGWLVQDEKENYYVYAQTMNGKTQYGLVVGAYVPDYMNGVIKKHELTRRDKEEDRMKHVRVNNANIEPVFFAYPDNAELDAIVKKYTSQRPEYDFIAPGDGFGHSFWVIDKEEDIKAITKAFEAMPALYIADGHHRSAAAALVGAEKAQQNANHQGNEEYNYFMAVCFPANQLTIIDYNRVVKDLNGLSPEQFLTAVSKNFVVEEKGIKVYKPQALHNFSLYLDGDYSNVGAVVGATYPEMGRVLRKVMPKAYILVPGYGAQGGQGKDLVDFFNPDGLGAIVNSSRGIIAAYTKEQYAKFGEKNFGEASRQAALDMIADINGALGK